LFVGQKLNTALFVIECFIACETFQKNHLIKLLAGHHHRLGPDQPQAPLPAEPVVRGATRAALGLKVQRKPHEAQKDQGGHHGQDVLRGKVGRDGGRVQGGSLIFEEKRAQKLRLK
jgi:hypothetical protein